MNKVSLLFALLLLQSQFILAQMPKTIVGMVQTADHNGMAGANCLLFSAKDTILIKGVITDATGRFQFQGITEGNYLIQIKSIGFESAMTKVQVSINHNNPINLPIIILKASTDKLADVIVQSKKLMIEQKIDRTVVNVDASPSNAGTNVLEVLEKSPGIEVDKDGNISLRGKQGVLVLIDGRPTYLSTTDLANYLKGMTSSSIDQIEIMTNPPAKYEAAGNAGIINIKTKKNKQIGLNGSVTMSVGQGVYNRNSTSFNLNYKKNKINLFTNINFSNWDGYTNLIIDRVYRNANGLVQNYFSQNSFMRNDEKNVLTGKIGMDYSVNKNTTMGIVLGGHRSPETERGNNTSLLMNANHFVDSIVKSNSFNPQLWKNSSANFYILHKYDTLGTELNVDMDITNFNTYNTSSIQNDVYNANETFRSTDKLIGNFPSTINIYAIKSDYTLPFKKGGKFEAGIKTSYVLTNNLATFYDVVTDQKFINYDKSNQFDYKENINAAYVNYSKEINKWGFQLGLRAENTVMNGHQLGNVLKPDSNFTRNYINVFPTTYITYKANEDNQFVLNYGKRIDRPAYQSLNPFVFYIDKYTYQSGNPYLQPQFTNNIEASHTYKKFLTTTLNYSYTNKLFTESIGQAGFATIVSTSNIGNKTNYGISVNAQLEAKKILSTSVYVSLQNTGYKGMANGYVLDNNSNVFIISVNNKFSFTNGWGAELSGFYRNKAAEGQIVIDPISQITAGVQKQVLKTKGTLKLSVRDIFLTNFPVGNINLGTTSMHFWNYRDTRIVNLSFAYRFGKTFKTVTRNIDGSEDEKNRVKTNNN